MTNKSASKVVSFTFLKLNTAEQQREAIVHGALPATVYFVFASYYFSM
jgi:hypothetical protein